MSIALVPVVLALQRSAMCLKLELHVAPDGAITLVFGVAINILLLRSKEFCIRYTLQNCLLNLFESSLKT